MKTFGEDLRKFEEMLRRRERFALVRYGDGELPILQGRPIRYAEFQYTPGEPSDEECRERLLASMRYRDPGYHVGVSCPDCIGPENHAWIRQTSGQDAEHLTWSTLFVNSNYASFRERFLPIFRHYQVVLICKDAATLRDLPFPVMRDFRVGNNAWKADHGRVQEIQDAIQRERWEGCLFLVCAGPFAKILVHRLYQAFPQNTYLDIGSTLDPDLFGSVAGKTRGYLRGNGDLAETCVWG
jgi:hypothetical protein